MSTRVEIDAWIRQEPGADAEAVQPIEREGSSPHLAPEAVERARRFADGVPCAPQCGTNAGLSCDCGRADLRAVLIGLDRGAGRSKLTGSGASSAEGSACGVVMPVPEPMRDAPTRMVPLSARDTMIIDASPAPAEDATTAVFHADGAGEP